MVNQKKENNVIMEHEMELTEFVQRFVQMLRVAEMEKEMKMKIVKLVLKMLLINV
jgi:hypothetical protein